jgi:hypothetical protein
LRSAGEEGRSALGAEEAADVPGDTVEFCRSWLSYTPFTYMWPFLRDEAHFVANVQARQTGKTFNGMAKLLWFGFKYPGSLILVTAPKFDQVKNVAFKALQEHLQRMKARSPELFRATVGDRNVLRTIVRLRNGSQILAESPIPETIRGHTAKVIYLMEANFIRDDEDLYTSVLFTLNTTNGFLIAESTPWNTDSVFYRMFHDPAYGQFSTHRVLYTEAMPPHGPLSPEIVEMIEKQLAGDPSRWRREMLCEWTEDTNTWLPTSLIMLAQDNALDYLDLDARPRGDFYVGADFGKKQDYSVVAVVEALRGHRILRHMRRFPLDTAYGAVIGYMKRLQEGWRTVRAIYADKTGVGDYIVEDMMRSGLVNVTGVNFTDTSKEAMATCLREKMRTADCPSCGWRGQVEDLDGSWRTTCPKGCSHEDGRPVGLRPLLHIPYDPDLYAELNVERFELGKSGKLLFSHPEGTHDDRFWALALSVYAVDMALPLATKPLAKVV